MTTHVTSLDVDRWRRPALIGVTVLILLAAVAVAVARYGAAVRADAVAIDFRLWLTIAERWQTTGSMYTAAQLAGPFDPQPMGWTTMDDLPSLYPPPAIFLFLPFLYLPAILWWVVPLGFIAFAVWRLRPAPWTWPVMSALFLFPEVSASIVVGSTTMWIVAFLAGGLLYHWPSVLILIKPTLAPFALVGVRHRSWWIAFAIWCVVALLMLDQWLDYVTVLRNIESTPLYSIGSVPFMLVPIVAWLGRRSRTPEPSST